MKRQQQQRLDDSSLLNIISRIGDGDAREIAACSLVCKRWRELRWAVPQLAFFFEVSGSEVELRDKEAIIASTLLHTKKAAPGCLKSLRVSITTGWDVIAHWLVYAADSVVELELQLQPDEEQVALLLPSNRVAWGPSAWSSLSCFKALEKLQITGRFCSRLMLPVANVAPFTTLTSCCFYDAYAVTAELLEALLAACSVLRDLRVDNFADMSRHSLRVVSSSLEKFWFFGDGSEAPRRQAYRIFLKTPHLTSLKVGDSTPVGTVITSVSREELSELELYGSCVLSGTSTTRYAKLHALTIGGTWLSESMVDALKLTCMVTDLTLDKLQVFGLEELSAGVFRLLPHLQRVHFDSTSLRAFRGYTVTELVFPMLTVHLWLFTSEASPNAQLLMDLLGVHQVRKLVVHYKLNEMVQAGNGFLHPYYENWRRLFDLMLSYPHRVELVSESDEEKWQEAKMRYWPSFLSFK